METFDKAQNALAHIASRYQGEFGLTAKDYPILKQCMELVIAALNEGRAAAKELAEIKSQTAQGAVG